MNQRLTQPTFGMPRFTSFGIAVLALALTGCPADTDRPDRPSPQTEEEQRLSTFQLEHGIGPFVQPVTLSEEVDEQLAVEGEDIFQRYCEVCHDMNVRMVGPPLGDVLERRTPTFVLNMMMNPEQMVREHPEGQEMLRQYPVVMPFQNITEEQALAILEYLRAE